MAYKPLAEQTTEELTKYIAWLEMRFDECETILKDRGDW